MRRVALAIALEGERHLTVEHHCDEACSVFARELAVGVAHAAAAAVTKCDMWRDFSDVSLKGRDSR